MNERDFKILLTLLEKYLKFIEKEVYAEKLLMAEDEMRNIDISDSPFLALSLTLNYPIWSNDKHFKKQKLVKVYTNREVLDLLGL